ncbi:PTS sugar transporter subunit IIA [Pseudoruegeria sp. SHC-113]|uniref:PTS sugar transporter subunit IIA n=1 Tax=Pseudoruegeria sp. SHC-113 TaxID=2855439 RepID=UPI0021BAB938|nr:PTS sugar transporter subunit IIA [Pseudoruegeria sp. SHC-113]MCT8158512.1 PTS sugar transporter subunit IIA [Pseudoruegeria sp. SHC-113]
MELSSILKSAAVKVVSNASSKKRMFQDLCDVAESCYGIPSRDAVEALLERESLGPTGVGNGIALPHARMDGIEHVVGVFLKMDKPLDFESVDRKPVDLVFALFAPVDSGVEHLKALALVSRTMRDPAICAKLRANDDPSVLHAILVADAGAQAA